MPGGIGKRVSLIGICVSTLDFSGVGCIVKAGLNPNSIGKCAVDKGEGMQFMTGWGLVPWSGYLMVAL